MTSPAAAASGTGRVRPKALAAFRLIRNQYLVGRYRSADRPRDGVGDGNNHVRVSVDDLPSEIAVALVPPLAGIPLDDEILPLGITQQAKHLPERLPKATTWLVNTCHRTRLDDRNSMPLGRFLRRYDPDRGHGQQTRREIAPPHTAGYGSLRASRVRLISTDRLCQLRRRGCRAIMPQELDTASPRGHLIEGAAGRDR